MNKTDLNDTMGEKTSSPCERNPQGLTIAKTHLNWLYEILGVNKKYLPVGIDEKTKTPVLSGVSSIKAGERMKET